MEYVSFEGEIPKGEYGAGTMTVWDHGRYESEKWSDREVKIVLHGTRANGSFVLFQTDGRNWMIHRHGDSVRTDPLPTSIKPMLAVQGDLPKNDVGWAYEVKWDGARAIVYSDGGRVTVRSRNDRDVTATFPELAALGEFLGMSPIVLDGEVVALGEDGRPSFARLQNRLHIGNPREARRRANTDPITYVAFDVLYADGRSLMDAPYDERRARLEALHLAGKHFITAESFRDASGPDVLQATVANGLEGVVAKRRDSVYRPGRRVADWVKVKTVRTQDVVIGGWTEGKGERGSSLGALLMGIPGPDGLHFAGKVGTGFDERSRRELLVALSPLAVRSSPFVDAVPAADAKVAHYVRPELVGEVAYGEWTPAGRLRHPRWTRLRSDKAVDEVSRESEVDDSVTNANSGRGESRPASSRRRAASSTGSRPTRVRVEDHEVPVTNLDKVLFPDTGFTKGQLIDYYARIAPAMLPHVADRPLTMKRYPDGVDGKFFFEKHVPSHAPRWVKTATVPSERQGEITYAVVSDLPSLVWAANLGTIEFHVPLWRAGRRRRLPADPDLMVFDLDPGEGTSIVHCCEVALLIVDALSGSGRGDAYAKTSGMKGLQLYYPVGPRTSWDSVREEAHGLARQLESEHQDLVVSTMRKDLRRGHVLIDWSQNHPAKTTVGVYSVRAAPFPSVSTPVTLSEVETCAQKGDPGLLRFDTEAVLARVEKHGDLFAGLDRT